MPTPPANPVLLFASIDISGSTAFKRKTDNWKSLLTGFFYAVPAQVRESWRKSQLALRNDEVFLTEYRRARGETPPLTTKQPRVWKTNGDEIVFVVELLSDFDVIAGCRCFLEVVYCCADQLKTKSGHYAAPAAGGGQAGEAGGATLSAKGFLWAASFHENSIAIPFSLLLGGAPGGEGLYEYLGISVDAGFRIGKYASENKVSISVELADKLVSIMDALGREELPGLHIKYDEGEPLKGLLEPGENYPKIYFDLNHGRKLNRAHDRLTKRDPANTGELRQAIDEIKARFRKEFFDWPAELLEFTVTPQDQIQPYADV
jgi:hypothetical protein